MICKQRKCEKTLENNFTVNENYKEVFVQTEKNPLDKRTKEQILLFYN